MIASDPPRAGDDVGGKGRERSVSFLFLLLQAALCIILILTGCRALRKGVTPVDPGFKGRSPLPTPVSGALTPVERICGSIAPPGERVDVDGMRMMVNAVVHPANETVAEGDPSNPTPEPGNKFLMVSPSIRCDLGIGENCELDPFRRFTLLDPSTTAYEPEPNIQGVPGLMEERDFPSGTTIYGGMVFEIEQEETDLVLMYEDPTGGSRACMAISLWAVPPTPTPSSTPTPMPTSTPTPLPTPTPRPTTPPSPLPTPTTAPLLPIVGSPSPLPLGLLAVTGALVLLALLGILLKGKDHPL